MQVSQWLSVSGSNILPTEYIELEQLGRLLIRYAVLLSFSIDGEDIFQSVFKAACIDFVAMAGVLCQDFQDRTKRGPMITIDDLPKTKRKVSDGVMPDELAHT